MTRALLLVWLALATLCSSTAAAAPFGGVVAFVESGPVRLDDAGVASFSIKNAGAETLHVNTLYARTNERDPRLPGTLSVAFEGGGTKADLAPGGTERVVVRWDRTGARVTQWAGHVVVESSDPAAPQRAMGVLGPSQGWLRDHLASLLFALPVLGGLAILALRGARAARLADGRLARHLALVSTGALLSGVIFAARGFDPRVGRADGNDGVQLVDRARLVGDMEWHLGVDGVSLPLLTALACLAFAGVLISYRVERRHEAFFAGYLAVVACAVGAILSIDAMLLVAFCALALAPIVALTSAFGGPRGRALAVRVVAYGGISVGALLVLVLALHRASEPTFLVDGTRGQPWVLGELARTAWVARQHAGSVLLGRPFVEGAGLALFVGAGVPLGIAPLHGWLVDLVAEVHAGAALVIVGAWSLLGALLWLRLGVWVLPEAVRWAAPALAWFGAATIAWGALAALGSRDLRRILAYVFMAHGGLTLLGIAACTPQGLTGAIAQASFRGLVLGLGLAVAGALVDRLRSTELARLGGLAKDAPRLSALAAGAWFAAACAPGTAPFASAALALVGALPGHRAACLVAAAGLVLLAFASAHAFRQAFLGPVGDWRQSPHLEPFGGHLPEVRRRETVALVALLLAVFACGLSPQLVVGWMRGTVEDLDARTNPEGISAAETRVSPRLALRP